MLFFSPLQTLVDARNGECRNEGPRIDLILMTARLQTAYGYAQSFVPFACSPLYSGHFFELDREVRIAVVDAMSWHGSAAHARMRDECERMATSKSL